MDEQTEQDPLPPIPTDGAPPPILAYRAPRDEKRRGGDADWVPAAIAIVLGTTLLLIAGNIMIHWGEEADTDDFGRYAMIFLLLLLGSAAATRSAWYYIGGWNQTADRGRSIRMTIRPWKWR